MAQSFTYDGADLRIIRDQTIELTEHADHGEIGTGRFTIDDETGTYDIVGHKSFTADQSACSVVRTFTGYIGSREYQRNIEKVGAARTIDVSTLDLNARLGFKIIRGRSWNRPRETIGERMTALLASSFLSSLVADYGFVDYPTDEMDKNDYRGQFPLDVIRDCALPVGYNYFVYWSEADAAAGLWFRDSNASTAFSSTLRLSNVVSDVDDSTTFAVGQETTLERDPSQVISGVLVPFTKGNVYRTRSATASNFQARDGMAPNSQIKKRAKAVTLGDRFLFERRNEEDVIHTTMLAVPDTKVNLVRAGQRIEAKFSHFATEGYGSFSWFRILEATKKPINAEGALYDIPLTLSPQECSGDPSATVSLVQYGVKSGLGTTVSLPAPATAGNLLVIVVGNRDEIALGPVGNPAAGWNYPPLVASPAYSINYVQADTAVGGTCECGHGTFYWKQADGGEQDYSIDNQMAAIYAEFSGFSGTITAISASAAETSDNLSAVVSATSGAPGVPSLVIGSLVTRTKAAGSFTPGAGTSQVGSLTQANIDGSGSCAFLYGFSDDGSAVTLSGSMTGPYKDDHAAWGMRMGAFEVTC